MRKYIKLLNTLSDAGEIIIKDSVTDNKVGNSRVWDLFNLEEKSLKSAGGRFTIIASNYAIKTLNVARKELGWELFDEVGQQETVSTYPESVGLLTISDADGNIRLRIKSLEDSMNDLSAQVIASANIFATLKTSSVECEDDEMAQIRKAMRLNPGDDAVLAAKSLRIMADTLIKLTEGK